MKQKGFTKGIITLVFLLSLCFCTLLVNATTAYANTMDPKLNVKTKAIVKGKDYALKVYNLSETQTVTFSSESPKIASVDANGVVTGLSVGSTVVTAVVNDSASAEPLKLECKITVGPPALFVMFSRQSADLEVGQRTLMSWMIAPLNTVELPKFSSSDPQVASVSTGGVVTAKSAGTAYIFAQIDNGQFSVCRVSVTTVEPDSVEEVSFEGDSRTKTSFIDFLINLNANFTNGDNTSENTSADTAQ